MTSRLAAPARPTFTTTGSMRALSAKDLIFAGMVAENMSVWRCPCTAACHTLRVSSALCKLTAVNLAAVSRQTQCAVLQHAQNSSKRTPLCTPPSAANTRQSDQQAHCGEWAQHMQQIPELMQPEQAMRVQALCRVQRAASRLTLKKEMMYLMSSSKPMSTMRSASSRHRYLQMSRFMRRLPSMSFKRPGVATHMCTPACLNLYQQMTGLRTL